MVEGNKGGGAIERQRKHFPAGLGKNQAAAADGRRFFQGVLSGRQEGRGIYPAYC